MENEKPRKFNSGKLLTYFAAIVVVAGLIATVLFYFKAAPLSQTASPSTDTAQMPASNVLPEIEASEFNGVKLVPVKDQGNNAIKGTRHINRKTYKLQVTGLVDNDIKMSYNELIALPSVAEAVYMPCVEGWGFNAKWTGFKVIDLLNKAGLKPEATYIMFWSDDGYSTGLPLDYIRDNDIIMAYGINDITLPDERGFPFQLVAKSKFGYKWAKWITKIEVLDHRELGYWEQRGYGDIADATGRIPEN
jgi:DMSO/TMAO reductase YedYZ molybdopterin-dependent catalytic subunit